MHQVVLEEAALGFSWIDVVDPKHHELDELAAKYGLPQAFVQDCLDPLHLPKFEQLETLSFLILRHFDLEAPLEGDTVQELTRKIAIFVGPRVLLTVHRKEQDFITQAMQKWRSRRGPHNEKLPLRIFANLFEASVQSFTAPCERGAVRLENFETQIFMGKGESAILEELYYLKRKATIFRRMVRYHMDMLSLAKPALNLPASTQNELRDSAERSLFHTEDLLDSANALLNAHLSISAHRTNEVMRILTVFSVFFMPLTFVVGIYGMNFQQMPELSHPMGYAGVWALMILITGVVYFWFKRRGWLSWG